MGEGAGLIREWPLVGEAEGPTGYLVGGTQQTPTPLYLSIPYSLETLGGGGGAGSWQNPPSFSPNLVSRGQQKSRNTA